MRKKFLIITNAYPHPNALYRNGFIHRRVKMYQKSELDIEVFVLHNAYLTIEHYVYEDVNVYRGNKELLEKQLKDVSYDKYLIHFVSEEMIEAIKNTNRNIPIIIWVHGYEAEAWHRRWFNFLENNHELESILLKSESYYRKQNHLMNYLYQTKELDLTFVHISRWFKEHIAECDARAITQNAYIIPNIVDENLFQYFPKEDEQRCRILSIRPYASRKYANDLSVKAVLELSKRPYFKSIHFAFYGDGKYFDETLAPIKGFENVEIHKGFLKQEKIAELHRQYGVFLCPTRLDSQGVSMCEAMSSGLVPISNNVSAIPEFIQDGSSGLLAEPEDWKHMSDLIERIYYHPDVFQKLSKNAANSIREKCRTDAVISKELDLLLDRVDKELVANQVMEHGNDYWYHMFEDLENQMKQMMKMQLEVNQHSKEKELEKQVKEYKVLHQRIRKTYLGKTTLLYLRIRRKGGQLLKRVRNASYKLVPNRGNS